MSLSGGFCGETLARAHARSGDRIAIDRRVPGRGRDLRPRAGGFTEGCADRNERDHRAPVEVVRAGRVTVGPS
ncbi:DUF2252 family protein [Streptomyces sp. NPDC101490]|uniref:DUF2252 family protein n=1 Tax=Streptomyces sp. NPDC101490 TaxID=3366143 RepID=UPI0037F1F400